MDNLIGSGVVFNIDAFFKELDQLAPKDDTVHKRIHVSSRCHLNFALHAAVDAASERQLGIDQIGTTKRGIGPSQSSKAAREGLRVIDLYHESFEKKFALLHEGYLKRYGELPDYSFENEIEKLRGYKKRLHPYIVDAVEYMKTAHKDEKSLLVESSQALSTSWPDVSSKLEALTKFIQCLIWTMVATHS